MQTLDPATTTFFRFVLAALLLTPYILLRRGHPSRTPLFRRLQAPRSLFQMLAAGSLLAANYALYISGLERTTAEAAQLVIQAAPMLLLLSGVWLFGERLSRRQWLGFFTFVTGLGLFFYPRFYDVFVAVNAYGIGIMLVFSAALMWTGYAIMQKLLLQQFSSQETMVIFYWLGTLAFLPFSDFSALRQLCRGNGPYRGIQSECNIGPDTVSDCERSPLNPARRTRGGTHNGINSLWCRSGCRRFHADRSQQARSTLIFSRLTGPLEPF